jgi:hypothetical protein
VVSLITRQSIDVLSESGSRCLDQLASWQLSQSALTTLEENFREQVEKSEWQMIVKMKAEQGVQ